MRKQGFAVEIKSGERFQFGANWASFLHLVDESRIRSAEDSLRKALGLQSLAGSSFLDVGSGSGLFSLAARRLGAVVQSFDYDPQSVACTAELRRRYRPEDPQWVIHEGSILDEAFLAQFSAVDVVYSWGVLHHTGDMHKALQNAMALVRQGGRAFVALYNDQGWISRYWKAVKTIYNANVVARIGVVLLHAPYLIGVQVLARALRGDLSVKRGMSLWYDMLDWLGGFPFEVAKPEVIFDVFHERGFCLERLVTCGGRMGCNEFVFKRVLATVMASGIDAPWPAGPPHA